LKQEKADEKEWEKEAKAEASATQHSFKSSQGQTFCQHCGCDHYDSHYPCIGKKNGHNFVLMKNSDGEWKITCKKCGEDIYCAGYPCR